MNPQEDLAKFAVPRFVRIVKEFPKTETQRIIKKELEKIGVVAERMTPRKIST